MGKGQNQMDRNEAKAKFWLRVKKIKNGCWEWTGLLFRGYGINGPNYFRRTIGTSRAHRISWHLHGKPLIPGMVLDHICRNRKCVKLSHLRQVTVQQNSTENNTGPAAANKIKTHCSRGHKYPEISQPGVIRHCLPCNAMYMRNKRAKQVIHA